MGLEVNRLTGSGTAAVAAGLPGIPVAPSLLPIPASAGSPAAFAKDSLPQSLLRQTEEDAASVVILLSKIPLLYNLGIKLYGALSKPKVDTPVVGNLGQLAPNLERGAQPTQQGFATLKQSGVQTVINLRPEEQWEEPMVKNLGLKYVYLPLPPVAAPTNEQALQFLSLATDPANGKVFFHCLHGADRTGAMAAAYRIAAQGWTADQAIAEMPKYHFHEGFEDKKLDFVRQFAGYWQSLPTEQQNQILHRAPNVPGVLPQPIPVPKDPGPPLTIGNQARLFTGDNDTYAEAIRLIAAAKTSIQFETFTFNGPQGLGITDALIQARQRGINVQVILDPKSMLVSDERALAQQLINAGVDVKTYQEVKLNHPLVAIDHAKILVIDAQRMLVGGTNFDRRVNYDLNYEVQGPAVPLVEDEFNRGWTSSKPTIAAKPPPNLPPVRPVPPASGSVMPGGDVQIGITTTGPKAVGKNSDQTYQDVLYRIQHATKSVDILMFTMDDDREIAALKAAKARGVNVRVILNNSSDKQGELTPLGNPFFNIEAVRALQSVGIPVKWFRNPPGTDEMHAKVAIFDRELALGGSTNWVHSSNIDNHELGVWLKGPIADQVQATFDNLWQTQTADVKPLSAWDKLKAFLMDAIAWVL